MILSQSLHHCDMGVLASWVNNNFLSGNLSFFQMSGGEESNLSSYCLDEKAFRLCCKLFLQQSGVIRDGWSWAEVKVCSNALKNVKWTWNHLQNVPLLQNERYCLICFSGLGWWRRLHKKDCFIAQKILFAEPQNWWWDGCFDRSRWGKSLQCIVILAYWCFRVL